MTRNLPTDTASEGKARIREAALLRRDALAEDARQLAIAQVVRRLAELPELAEAGSIAGFWPIRSEIDILPVLEVCHERGQIVSLPVVTTNGLVFRRWLPGDVLFRRSFGLSEPDDSSPEIKPQALLIPLAAFDRNGARIGYGKGYYDRAIASLGEANSVMTIGVAFAIQEAQSIPQEPHDRHLSVIVTETEVIRVQG